jgi:hemoglobin
LEPHLEILVDFWDHILFGSSTYRKNAMKPHLDLHAQSPLEFHHFKTWLQYFHESVDHYFAGEKAFLIKERQPVLRLLCVLRYCSRGYRDMQNL